MKKKQIDLHQVSCARCFQVQTLFIKNVRLRDGAVSCSGRLRLRRFLVSRRENNLHNPSRVNVAAIQPARTGGKNFPVHSETGCNNRLEPSCVEVPCQNGRILPSDTRRSVLQVFCAAWHRVIPMSETIRHSVPAGPLFPGYIDEWIIADSQTSTAGIAHAACYEEIFLAFKKSRVLCGMVQSDVATRLSYSAGTKSPTASSRLHQDLFNPTVFFSSRQFTILTDMPRRLRDSLYRSVSGPAVAGDLHVLFGMWLFKLS